MPIAAESRPPAVVLPYGVWVSSTGKCPADGCWVDGSAGVATSARNTVPSAMRTGTSLRRDTAYVAASGCQWGPGAALAAIASSIGSRSAARAPLERAASEPAASSATTAPAIDGRTDGMGRLLRGGYVRVKRGSP